MIVVGHVRSRLPRRESRQYAAACGSSSRFRTAYCLLPTATSGLLRTPPFPDAGRRRSRPRRPPRRKPSSRPAAFAACIPCRTRGSRAASSGPCRIWPLMHTDDSCVSMSSTSKSRSASWSRYSCAQLDSRSWGSAPTPRHLRSQTSNTSSISCRDARIALRPHGAAVLVLDLGPARFELLHRAQARLRAGRAARSR